jgi:hypothetical protein
MSHAVGNGGGLPDERPGASFQLFSGEDSKELTPPLAGKRARLDGSNSLKTVLANNVFCLLAREKGRGPAPAAHDVATPRKRYS